MTITTIIAIDGDPGLDLDRLADDVVRLSSAAGIPLEAVVSRGAADPPRHADRVLYARDRRLGSPRAALPRWLPDGRTTVWWSDGRGELPADRSTRRLLGALRVEPLSVTVVVPARDRAEHLDHTLAHLARQDYPGPIDVVVVDDGSTDTTADVAEARRARVVRLATPGGPAAARNAGLRTAHGDLTLFLDADMLAPPDLVADHVALHEHVNDLVVVGARRHLPAGQVGLEPAPEQRDSREALLDRFSSNLASLHAPWLVAYTCNLSVDSALLGQLAPEGPFDEDLVGWGLEDIELAYRLSQLGARWAFSPCAGLHQHHDRTFDAARFTAWSANLARLIHRHPELLPLEALGATFDPAIGADHLDVIQAVDATLAGSDPPWATGRPTTRVEVTANGPGLIATLNANAAGSGPLAVVDVAPTPGAAILAEEAVPGRRIRLFTDRDVARLGPILPPAPAPRRVERRLPLGAGASLAVVDDLPATAARATLVVAHGLTGDRVGPQRLFAFLAARLAEAGVRTTRFDHRGAGESSGSSEAVTFAAMAEDLGAVLDDIGPSTDGRPLALLGMSLGAITAARVAAGRDDVDAVIIVSHELEDDPPLPPADGRVGAGWFQLPPSFFAERARLSPRSDLRSRGLPVLQLVGELDEKVQAATARNLRSPWPERTRRDLAGATHLLVEPAAPQRLVDEVTAFLSSLEGTLHA
ncbi:MAG: hypothetical protein JWM47_832 [Acidimicrobiales bacterium]|nr:hypothetical protein [Acidimicrobiales bacterium]